MLFQFLFVVNTGKKQYHRYPVRRGKLVFWIDAVRSETSLVADTGLQLVVLYIVALSLCSRRNLRWILLNVHKNSTKPCAWHRTPLPRTSPPPNTGSADNSISFSVCFLRYDRVEKGANIIFIQRTFCIFNFLNLNNFNLSHFLFWRLEKTNLQPNTQYLRRRELPMPNQNPTL